MRRVVIAAVLLAVGAPPAVAAPVGAPLRLGTARAADHAARPGAVSEWWTLRLVDPRSQAWLEIVIEREHIERTVQISGVDPSGKSVAAAFALAELDASRSRLDGSGAGTSVRVRAGGRRIELASPGTSGAIRLRAARRGPAAYGWRLGKAVGRDALGPRRVTLSWAMPIATSTARGVLTLPDGVQIDLDGWRAAYDHRWGDILSRDTAAEFWDEVVVHRRRRVASIAFGMNRLDTITGPGARDAQWLGILARVGRAGVRVCRPRVRRKGWKLTHPRAAAWSSRSSFGCRGHTLHIRDGAPEIRDVGTHTEIRSRVRSRVGFALHRAVNLF